MITCRANKTDVSAGIFQTHEHPLTFVRPYSNICVSAYRFVEEYLTDWAEISPGDTLVTIMISANKQTVIFPSLESNQSMLRLEATKPSSDECY